MGDMQGVQGAVRASDEDALIRLVHGYTKADLAESGASVVPGVRGIGSERFNDEVPRPYIASVVLAGNKLQVVESSRPISRSPKICSLGDGLYLRYSTGEICEFRTHDGGRVAHLGSLRRTFRRIRYLINANATRPELLKWVTLTYNPHLFEPGGELFEPDRFDPENDKGTYPAPKDVSKDFKKFSATLRNYEDAHGLPRNEYIWVLEPQASGMWHLHILLIWKSPCERAPFIPKETMASMWSRGAGRAKVQLGFISVNDCDKAENLGAYLSAYLGNAEVRAGESAPNGCREFEAEVFDPQTGEKRTKRFAKGARLAFYPKGVKIYGTSRGVARDRKISLDWSEKEMLEDSIGAEYTACKEVISDDGYRMLLRYRTYDVRSLNTVVRPNGEEHLDLTGLRVSECLRDWDDTYTASYGDGWRYLGLDTGDD